MKLEERVCRDSRDRQVCQVYQDFRVSLVPRWRETKDYPVSELLHTCTKTPTPFAQNAYTLCITEIHHSCILKHTCTHSFIHTHIYIHTPLIILSWSRDWPGQGIDQFIKKGKHCHFSQFLMQQIHSYFPNTYMHHSHTCTHSYIHIHILSVWSKGWLVYKKGKLNDEIWISCFRIQIHTWIHTLFHLSNE